MDSARSRARLAREGNLTLAACVAVLAVLFVGSDAVATRSGWLWEQVRRGASGSEDAAVVLEAQAFALAQEPPLAALVMGSSVADADFSTRVLAAELGVPGARVDKLWMPAMSDVELAMLAPLVHQLRPRRVLVPVTPFLLLGDLRWDRTRTYAPRIALRVFSPGELFRDRGEHSSRAFAATHLVVRRRSALRRVLLGSHRDLTAMPPQGERPRIGEQIWALQHARLEDFRCDTVHARALSVFAAEVQAAGATLVVASAPIAERSIAGSVELRNRLDACLASLSLSGARVRFGRERPEFGRRDFRDLIHLERRAAERFSRWALDRPEAGETPRDAL